MNGAVEAGNKNIKKIFMKMVVTYNDCHKILPYILYAYITAIKTSTGATPYSLVYGMEVVISIKIKISSLRVLVEANQKDNEWVQVHYE